ncbi:MAG UNVERIFIED_CONTAM: hypothetical protein LOD86_12550, partial [Thermobifida fusca]
TDDVAHIGDSARAEREAFTASLAEARQAAAERLAALEEARTQTLRRAERAEAQLDEALAELRRLRAAVPAAPAADDPHGGQPAQP